MITENGSNGYMKHMYVENKKYYISHSFGKKIDHFRKEIGIVILINS